MQCYPLYTIFLLHPQKSYLEGVVLMTSHVPLIAIFSPPALNIINSESFWKLPQFFTTIFNLQVGTVGTF
jgi:hypothetical protein